MECRTSGFAPAVWADDGNRDALERIGALLVAFGAIPDRLGFVHELMRLDTRADLQAAPQRRLVVYPLTVESAQQAAQRHRIQAGALRVGCAGPVFELRYACFFSNALLSHAVV